jgi:hypothetical protein
MKRLETFDSALQGQVDAENVYSKEVEGMLAQPTSIAEVTVFALPHNQAYAPRTDHFSSWREAKSAQLA